MTYTSAGGTTCVPAAITCARSGLPPTSCSTFGYLDFSRVPLPAAIIAIAKRWTPALPCDGFFDMAFNITRADLLKSSRDLSSGRNIHNSINPVSCWILWSLECVSKQVEPNLSTKIYCATFFLLCYHPVQQQGCICKHLRYLPFRLGWPCGTATATKVVVSPPPTLCVVVCVGELS